MLPVNQVVTPLGVQVELVVLGPQALALSPDGTRLYVCGNLSNTLLERDAVTDKVLRTFEVGVAPFDVVLLGEKAYVSNWGGRRPGATDLVGPAGRGTTVRVDPIRHIASEGSVSIVSLRPGFPAPNRYSEILTGLHASALALSPDRRWLVCANAAADNLTVLDTRTDTIAETIWVKPKPSDLLGATPNALVFAPRGNRLYVANGTQNAVAVVDFKPARKRSRLVGLIPVDWFPGALAWDEPRRQLCVANIKGHPLAPKAYTDPAAAPEAEGYNTHHYSGSVSLVPVPAGRDLPELSQTVWNNLRRERIAEALLPARANQPPRAIHDPQLRCDALASSRMNFRQVDRAPEDTLNRILWRAMRGSREPYPLWAVTLTGNRDDDDD